MVIITIPLEPLISEVRLKLANLPNDLGEDEQIFYELKAAQEYIECIKDADFEDDVLEKAATLALGTYFMYINYTSLASRQYDTIPAFYYVKAGVLKDIALSFIRQLTSLPIDNNLSVDEKTLTRVSASTIGTIDNIWQ